MPPMVATVSRHGPTSDVSTPPSPAAQQHPCIATFHNKGTKNRSGG